MNLLPVSSSIINKAAVAELVKVLYNLSGSWSARILKTGISHTYLLSGDTGKFIFRIYDLNWRTEKEIAEEIRLLRLLAQNGLPVSYPIADGGNEYIQKLRAPEGIRFAVMFSFAEGDKMLNIPAALHFTIGETMANLHQLTHNMTLERVNYSVDVLLKDSFEKMKSFLSMDTDEMKYMQKLKHYLEGVLVAAANDHSLRKGVVHLDIWFDNLVIQDNREVTLFDFDFCGNGWLFLDIGYYLLQLYSTEKVDAEHSLKKEQFLKGYASVTPIPAAEMSLMGAAGASIYFFYLGVQCQRFDNWSNNFLNDIYLKRFINLLVKKWADFNGLPVA